MHYTTGHWDEMRNQLGINQWINLFSLFGEQIQKSQVPELNQITLKNSHSHTKVFLIW